MMANELEGQVALITGGGRGIGRAIAQVFAAAGAAVAVTSRTSAEIDETVVLIQAAGGKALALTADVTDFESMQKVVAATKRGLGPIDVLVNNAGAPGAVGPVWEVDLDDWRRCLETNFVGPFLAARAVLPGMIERRRGRILNIASGAALRPVAYDTAYSTSKAALLRLTEAMAMETAEYGITVFAIAPGVVRTTLQDPVINTEIGRKWLPDFGRSIEARAKPAEVPAQLCLLMASGAADALNGRFVSTADVIPALVARAEEIQASNALTLQLKTLG
jgi:NAD(P)-dependent dehydrogenase (short-subunit alcohol dehydrogenase family)